MGQFVNHNGFILSIDVLFNPQRRAKKSAVEKADTNTNGEKKGSEKKPRASALRRDSDYDREASKPINHFFKQERATQTMNRYSKVGTKRKWLLDKNWLF